MVRMVDGTPRPFGDDKPPKGNRAVAGAAIAVVLSALAGGGAGTAASVGGTIDDLNVKTPRSEAELRVSGTNESLKATIRLKRMGLHYTRLDADSDNRCDTHSDGDVQSFFRAHPCLRIERMIIETPLDKDIVVRFATATITMPDDSTAIGLYSLLAQGGHRGNITPLSRELSQEHGKYRHIPFTGPTHLTRNDTTVITTQVEPVGRTPGADVLANLATSLLVGL